MWAVCIANIIHLMSDPEGDSSFCFPKSPDVSRVEVESNQRITGANQNSRLGTYNNTNLIL